MRREAGRRPALPAESAPLATRRFALMLEANPLYIPRNHRIAAVISAGASGPVWALLPVKDLVLFPYMIVPLLVAREAAAAGPR